MAVTRIQCESCRWDYDEDILQGSIAVQCPICFYVQPPPLSQQQMINKKFETQDSD
jgi:hypothetical protein